MIDLYVSADSTNTFFHHRSDINEIENQCIYAAIGSKCALMIVYLGLPTPDQVFYLPSSVTRRANQEVKLRGGSGQVWWASVPQMREISSIYPI